MDIEGIKSTPLGRAWLSVFVRRVWEGVLGASGRNRLRFDTTSDGALGFGRFVRYPVDRDDYRDDDCFRAGELMDDERRLTPLGVEVYLYGRKQQRRAQPTGDPGGFACSGPMGGPGAGPMRRVGG